MKWAICLALLVGAGSAQTVDVNYLHKTSMRWVEHYAAVYRVPVELVEAIIDEESRWNPYAVSSKGAAGIMQLMPETAFRFGVHDRFSVNENVRGGVAYLAWLKNRFGGDLRLVTAAYYVGESSHRCSTAGIFIGGCSGLCKTSGTPISLAAAAGGRIFAVRSE